MKNYMVLCVEQCPACKGAGVVQNPIWRRYFAKTPNDKPADADAWARANGYRDTVDMGPEEVTCSGCNGEKHITVPTPLIETLRVLGVVMISKSDDKTHARDTLALTALRAIIARLSGELNDPELAAFGFLSTNVLDDCLAIARAALPKSRND